MAITIYPAPSAGAANNDFSVSVGSTTNTTYVLGSAYPAGKYEIKLDADTTYDIYAIASNGTAAGYTKTNYLIATAEFKELVILGAANGETVRFIYLGASPEPSSKGDVAVAGAFITSIATSSLPNTDDSTVITGGNFAPGLEVVFTGIDSVARAAKSVTRTNSTTATAVRPDTFPASASPFSIKVSNPGVVEPTDTEKSLLAAPALGAG